MTLVAELGSLRGQKWNIKRVIIFQSVILQCVQLVTGAKNIWAWMNVELNSWNSGAFDELVCDSYAVATSYLGKAHRDKNSKQQIHTLLDLFIRGKLCKAIRFVFE